MAVTSAMTTTPPSIPCPKCAHANPVTADFCTACHQILIHRCPKCWHEQRTGAVCEKCGTCFALYWEQAFERAVEEENRESWAKFGAAVLVFLQLLFLPFMTLGGLLRALVARLIDQRLSNR